MSGKITIDKGRTKRLTMHLGIDITGDTITSEIRTQPEATSTLIATWTVTVEDAPTGAILLVLDNTITGAITQVSGYMDVKRVSGGEPLSVFEEPLEVYFQGVPTA